MKKEWTRYGFWKDDKREKERETKHSLGVWFGSISWGEKYEGKDMREFQSMMSTFPRDHSHENVPYPSGEDAGYASFSYEVRNDITSFSTLKCEKELLSNPEVDFVRLGGVYFFHQDDIRDYKKNFKVEFISYCKELIEKYRSEKREIL